METTTETPTRPCTKCEGRLHSSWAVENDREGPEGKRCFYCDGRGTFAEPNYTSLLALLVTKKRLRRSWPSNMNAWRAAHGGEFRRAYYVWRIARFNGGADVTMPMTAIDTSAGDPWVPELDKMADEIAKRAFGTDMAAAHRWHGALGENRAPAGMPATAYQGGPETDGEEPVY